MHYQINGDGRICLLALDHTRKGPRGTLDLFFAAANTAFVLLKVLRVSVN